MLGWEYPPHMSGGLGTACEGLTTALAQQGVEITFVVPHLTGAERANHMRMIDAPAVDLSPEGSPGAVRTHRVASTLQPYQTPAGYEQLIDSHRSCVFDILGELIHRAHGAGEGGGQYGRDIFAEVARYAERVLALGEAEEFDLIHAHDWMTFPAAMLLKERTGKPLVVHVHSLERDRSGEHVNPRIDEIERRGLEAADIVVAVSFYTRSVINQHHGIPLEKIQVVHNGVYTPEVIQPYRRARGWPNKVVLFLGRITFQKGPEYFVEAAAKVVPHVPDALFVMAGTGDMLPRMVDRVKQLGLTEHFYFPGFLRGQEVEQIFSLADVYVMPSVSEPFGIAALEAISFETPVIISRQSGVAEVLEHALKVDFWDTNRLADLLVNALLHEELRADMAAMARDEVRRLRWSAAALKTVDIYRMIV